MRNANLFYMNYIGTITNRSSYQDNSNQLLNHRRIAHRTFTKVTTSSRMQETLAYYKNLL
jgi:hypothetical protein